MWIATHFTPGERSERAQHLYSIATDSQTGVFPLHYGTMKSKGTPRTFLFFVAVIAMLIYWDFHMKFRLLFSVRWGQKYAGREVPQMSMALFRQARQHTGFQLEFSNGVDEPIPNPCVIVANHQSLVDIVALLAFLQDHQLRFAAKQELGKWFPGVSQALRLLRHALIPRSGNVSRGLRELKRLGRMAKHGVTPVIFPEGTRSRTGELRPFNTGAVRLIQTEASLPIVAVAVHGGYRLAHMTDIVDNIGSSRYRARIVKVLPPPTGRGGVQERLRECRAAIEEQVEAWKREDEEQ